mmetsp:Transcript_32102/g.49088  ORF Transcript_32102/g.49088 Transcript_32102/m.49088 type:complete len:134 (+) Transcript_32102:56-457(+)
MQAFKRVKLEYLYCVKEHCYPSMQPILPGERTETVTKEEGGKLVTEKGRQSQWLRKIEFNFKGAKECEKSCSMNSFHEAEQNFYHTRVLGPVRKLYSENCTEEVKPKEGSGGSWWSSAPVEEERIVNKECLSA